MVKGTMGLLVSLLVFEDNLFFDRTRQKDLLSTTTGPQSSVRTSWVRIWPQLIWCLYSQTVEIGKYEIHNLTDRKKMNEDLLKRDSTLRRNWVTRTQMWVTKWKVTLIRLPSEHQTEESRPSRLLFCTLIFVPKTTFYVNCPPKEETTDCINWRELHVDSEYRKYKKIKSKVHLPSTCFYSLCCYLTITSG